MSRRLPGALRRWLTLLPDVDLLAARHFIDSLLSCRQDTGSASSFPPGNTGDRPGGIWYRQEKVRCGKSGCRKCASADGHGPYWYAYYRQGRKMKSRYIGKDLPA